MEGRSMNTYAVITSDDPFSMAPFPFSEDGVRDDEVESIGNESMRVNVNANASDVVSLDDNNSQMSQIDPGNFSESDIDDEVSVENQCPSLSDVLGGFPESDIDDEEDMSDEEEGISFNSDIGSPMHSSCRSYTVSEDRDDRDEATPLPLNGNDAIETNIHPTLSSQGDYETYNESEMSAPIAQKKDDEHKSMRIRFRNSIHGRKIAKAQSQPPYPKKTAKKIPKSNKKSTSAGKRKALAVMRLLSDEIPTMSPLFCLPMRSTVKEESSTRSLSSIPILDLCITEDEGYLGMAEETSNDSDKEKDENKLPVNLTEV